MRREEIRVDDEGSVYSLERTRVVSRLQADTRGCEVRLKSFPGVAALHRDLSCKKNSRPGLDLD
jgi:hypothetical protein